MNNNSSNLIMEDIYFTCKLGKINRELYPIRHEHIFCASGDAEERRNGGRKGASTMKGKQLQTDKKMSGDSVHRALMMLTDPPD